MDILTWEEYFMGVAVLSSKRSKDPRTKNGACIVNPDKLIVGTGYNGAPRGWNDEEFPWYGGSTGGSNKATTSETLEQKYPYVIHAELNAILNSGVNTLAGATMYVTLFPCNECAKAIAQRGIRRVVYLRDTYADADTTKAAKRMFDKLGIKYDKFKSDKKAVEIGFVE